MYFRRSGILRRYFLREYVFIMADTAGLRSGFDSLRVIMLSGITLFTCAIGVSGYIYDQKAIHRSEILKLQNTITLEIERRADNELLIMTLEGSVKNMEMMIKQDRIRQENFIYQLSTQIADNRIMLSDWASTLKKL